MTAEPLLAVTELDVVYQTDEGRLLALADISFEVRAQEILGVVGESGCGKTTLSAALMGLLPPNGRITRGQVLLDGRDRSTASSTCSETDGS